MLLCEPIQRRLLVSLPNSRRNIYQVCKIDYRTRSFHRGSSLFAVKGEKFIQSSYNRKARYRPFSAEQSLKRVNFEKMPDQISINFLGTAAGQPSETRNVSSLALKIDKPIWVFDAGEATQHQFMKSTLRMSQITKIFITHMHGDHVNGLVGLLCTISAAESPDVIDTGEVAGGKANVTSHKPIEIYGPRGLRNFVRLNLQLTYSSLVRPYVVHELLFDGDDDHPAAWKNATGMLHPNELPGRDLRQTNGIWANVVPAHEIGVEVSAGPILHTVPCIGYVLNEQARPLPIVPENYVKHLLNPINSAALLSDGIAPLSVLSKLKQSLQPITLADGTVLEPPRMGPPGRKITILGDTYDASAMIELAKGSDVVIHESTNAFLPTLDKDQQEKVSKGHLTQEMVRQKARDHGHSTPEVAGAFAKAVGTNLLLLNHLSVKYQDPDGNYSLRGTNLNDSAAISDDTSESTDISEVQLKRTSREQILQEIGRLALMAWTGEDVEPVFANSTTPESKKVVVARDLITINVPRKKQ